MATLSDLQAQRDQIVSAMSQPEEVRFESRLVRQRSQQDLDAALRRIDAEIAKLQTPGATKFTIQTSRGLQK